jgi:hypothetical protein
MKRTTLLSQSLGIALVLTGILSSCRENPADHSQDAIQFSADTTVVTRLAITVRPVTDSLARIIADSASTGKAISSESETEGGTALFEVQEQVGILTLGVRVRASDGAILTRIDDGDHGK